jgi:hypothetical protein
MIDEPLNDRTDGTPDSSAATVSRRDVVKMLGLVPLAGAIAWTGADVERAASRVRELVLSQAPQQFTPKFFTPDEWRALNVLVDLIIPRDATSGSATDARVPEFIDFMLTDTEQNISQGTLTAWRTGLAWMDEESNRRFSSTFVGASDAQRRQILDDIAFPARARPGMMPGVNFFNRARNMTAAGFFSTEMGWRDIGYIGNTAIAQWTGCPQPALAKLGVSYDLMNSRIPPRNG